MQTKTAVKPEKDEELATAVKPEEEEEFVTAVKPFFLRHTAFSVYKSRLRE
jgi:hypothetical protein